MLRCDTDALESRNDLTSLRSDRDALPSLRGDLDVLTSLRIN